ncbi:urease accessory protein UreE [Thioalkalivibrio sp.]|uniref:urease accessory protein UreE n=1 Tax=Thioalkalivibrio sp. TaxID=2093813 RepID=UPI0012D57D74|nr:urease accessory protein UreE [Thioalkalivibrio sp.]TVP81663.1 MAG: urease accessory protein UreE [Thioalkalivibrio sp.]
MLTLTRRCTTPADITAMPVLRLPFETRQKSRFRALLTDGTEVGVMLERGQVLRDGECLCAAAGDVVVRVQAAPEPVSEAHSADALLLLRAGYHLGNRHVPLQLGHGWLRYLHDHVLDEMLRGLGLTVGFKQAPFEPESGAYAAGGHAHSHAHGHQHAH